MLLLYPNNLKEMSVLLLSAVSLGLDGEVFMITSWEWVKLTST